MLTDQWLLDEAGEKVRAYKASEAAEQLTVTAKTVINWAQRPNGSYPALRGWAPRTERNPNRHWLVAADDVDVLLEEQPGRTASAGSGADELGQERQRLADERQLLEMERSVFNQERVSFLEEENARLKGEVAELRAKVAAMGRVVFDLTTTST